MDDLNKYGDQKQRKQLTYAAKQLIAREVKLVTHCLSLLCVYNYDLHQD